MTTYRKEMQFLRPIVLWLILLCVPVAMGFSATGNAIMPSAAAATAPSAPGSGLGTQTQETQVMPAHGAGKEEVRGLWGDPVEVRKIRTCFGWQEEWIYRGDPQRYGAEERTLLFDEGEVLSEIK